MLRMEGVRELHYNRCMGSVLTEYMRSIAEEKRHAGSVLKCGVRDFGDGYRARGGQVGRVTKRRSGVRIRLISTRNAPKRFISQKSLYNM